MLFLEIKSAVSVCYFKKGGLRFHFLPIAFPSGRDFWNLTITD